MRAPAAILAALALLAWPTPAQAAGVGFSLPKLRALTLDGNTSWGGSVQVIGGAFNVGLVRVDLALDYAYTRDFKAGANYSFFDGLAGLGVPLSFTPAFYVMPALDGHVYGFVATPEDATGAAFGVAPRLTFGYHPTPKIAVELGASEAVVLGAKTATRSLSGLLTTVELGGTVSF